MRGPRSVLMVIFGWLIVFLLVAGQTIAIEGENDTSAPIQRSLGDYRRDLKAFMKHSKCDQPEIQRAAIYNLCELHYTIVHDPRFESSQTLQGMRVVAANRLKDFANRFKKQKMRNNRKHPKASLRAIERSTRVATTERVPQTHQATENDVDAAMAGSFDAMSRIGGGPSQIFTYAGGRFAPPWDHGADLVDLIENTINPAFWQRNGGTGVIHYFQPLRVLVVGASAQAHEDTLDLLKKIRFAGQ